MIEIDGSHGEGGGSLLRISAALSALKGDSIHIHNIRAKRPKSGLMPQHLNAIKAVAQLTRATCKGLEISSSEVLFSPNNPQGGKYEIDIGTAGSITLVLQCFMIPAAFASSPVEITLRGGTDVRWSPPVDYLQNVTLPLLKSVGYQAKMNLLQRGHYPRGGGILKAKIWPVKKLGPINFLHLKVNKIRGISHAAKLPEHVAQRQAQSAEKVLKSQGYEVDIEIQHSNKALGPGSGIVLWSEGESRVGGSSIGKPGKRAEIVGQEAADELLYHISKKSALDGYMGDQIIPYVAIAGNSVVKTGVLTSHALTNIYASCKITGQKFKVKGELGDSALIKVD